MLVMTLVSTGTFRGCSVCIETFSSSSSACVGKRTLGQTFIGANKDVSAEYYSCITNTTPQKLSAVLAKNGTTNVCGLACTTNCYSGSGGPVPNDCQVIADALLYESQHTGQCDGVSVLLWCSCRFVTGNNVVVGAAVSVRLRGFSPSVKKIG